MYSHRLLIECNFNLNPHEFEEFSHKLEESHLKLHLVISVSFDNGAVLVAGCLVFHQKCYPLHERITVSTYT